MIEIRLDLADLVIEDHADDPHLTSTARTFQRIDLVNASNKTSSASRRHNHTRTTVHANPATIKTQPARSATFAANSGRAGVIPVPARTALVMKAASSSG